MHIPLSRFLIVIALALLGCVAPPATVSPTPSEQPRAPAPSLPPPLDFRLGHPIGKHSVTRARDPFTVTLSQCDGAQRPEQQVYVEALSLPQSFVIGDGQDGSPLDAEAAVMAAAVRRFYDLDQGTSRAVIGEIALEAPADAQAVYTLRWDEIWDQNELQALSGERLVATLPLAVLTSAQLVSESVSITHCPPLATGAPALSTAIPSGVDESEAATALVQGYLERLNARDYQGAYALLAPEYQRLVPYDRYVEGYEPVSRLEVLTLSSETTSDGLVMVRARLALTLQRQGALVTSPWESIYWLDRRPGDEEAWRLVRVEMTPTLP